MQKITTFDKRAAIGFARELEEAIKKIGEEFGVTLKVRPKTYNPNSMRAELHISIGEKHDIGSTPRGYAFKSMAPRNGIPADKLGATFRHKNTLYKIVGWNPGAWKYPVECERFSDGAIYKFPVDVIRNHV